MKRRPTALSVVRRVFPDVTRQQAHDLLWDRTRWPFYGKGEAVREIVKALRVLKATLKAGKWACDNCNRPVRGTNFLCPACARAWRERRNK